MTLKNAFENLAVESKQDDLLELLGNRYGGGKTAVTATVTDSGDNVVYTPASGNFVRLFYVSAINDPDEATVPLIKVLLGADELYRAYALAHWEPFDGDVDAELIVNLSGAASIAFTAHLQEITP